MRFILTVFSFFAFPALVSCSQSETAEQPAGNAIPKCNWWIDAMTWLEFITLLFPVGQFGGITVLAGHGLNERSR